ncbi:MAG: MBL fold metallo-hydrolase [Actinobacteria bacterium]|nr:MBL fold metallo-hydrolase [Actinomycetota bacterium]
MDSGPDVSMSDLTMTVLGCNSGGPTRGVGASGYLVTADTTSLVLDMGSGTLQPLFGVLPDVPDAVVVTHRHVDHLADLFGLYGYIAAERRAGRTRSALRVIAPAGVEEAFAGALQAGPTHGYRDIVTFEEPTPGEVITVGVLECAFAEANHSVPAIAVRVSHLRRSLTYTGDTGPSSKVEELAAATDLLIAEAGNDRDQSTPYPFHLTVAGAVTMASRSAAGQLLLTHLHLDATVDDVVAAVAAAKYPGEVQLAAPGLTITLEEETF